MPPQEPEFDALILTRLTPDERGKGVAYVSEVLHEPGETLTLSAQSVSVPWRARLAFVDGDPTANWGHACRYLLIGEAADETLSIEGRFPPFGRQNAAGWRIAYRAPGVSDTALLALPDSTT